MLLDIEQKDKEVIVSYYNKEGTVSFKRYAVDKFQNWVVAKDNDKWKDRSTTNWDGRPLKKSISKSFNKFSLLYFMDGLPQKDQDEIFEFNMPKTYFVDIETEIVDGFPKPEEAKSRILTFSIITPDKKAIVLDVLKILFPDLSIDQTMMIDTFIDFICQNDMVNKLSSVSKFVGSLKKIST